MVTYHIPGTTQGTSQLPQTISGSLSNSADLFSQGRQNDANRTAYTNYLDYLGNIAGSMGNALTSRADQYDNKLQNQISGLESKMLSQPSQYENKLQSLLYDAEPQYLQEANTQLSELSDLNNAIANESTVAQRENRNQVNANLAQQGVRGGQAAVLANRATGTLNRQLQNDITSTTYDEAKNRQNSRLNYTQSKALLPYQAMANAYGNAYQNASNNISNAYGNSYQNANSALSQAYGNSLSGANSALSQAQGNIYQNAYNTMLNNYLQTQKQGNGTGSALGGALGSVLGGAIGTYAGNPAIGATLGNAAGSYLGGLF